MRAEEETRDGRAKAWLKTRNEEDQVIIVGGGFGGVYTALRLDKTLARRADVE